MPTGSTRGRSASTRLSSSSRTGGCISKATEALFTEDSAGSFALGAVTVRTRSGATRWPSAYSLLNQSPITRCIRASLRDSTISETTEWWRDGPLFSSPDPTRLAEGSRPAIRAFRARGEFRLHQRVERVGRGKPPRTVPTVGEGLLEAHARVVADFRSACRQSTSIVGESFRRVPWGHNYRPMRIVSLCTHVPHKGIPNSSGQFTLAWFTALSPQGTSSSSFQPLRKPFGPEGAAIERRGHLCPRRSATEAPRPISLQCIRRCHSGPVGSLRVPGLGRFEKAVAAADVVEIHMHHLLPLVSDVCRVSGRTPVTAIVPDVMTQKVAPRTAVGDGHQRKLGSYVRARRAARMEPELFYRLDLVLTFSPRTSRATRWTLGSPSLRR